jgi:four helix bundle protein
MTPDELKERTLSLAVEVVRFCCDLRRRSDARHIADQLSDSATSAAMNYRAACRARSHREFRAKLGIALEEADESVGWLTVIIRAGLDHSPRSAALLAAMDEIVAIFVASRKTAEARQP